MADERLIIAAEVDPRGVQRGMAAVMQEIRGAASGVGAALSRVRIDADTLFPREVRDAAAEEGRAIAEAVIESVAETTRSGRGVLSEAGNSLGEVVGEGITDTMADVVEGGQRRIAELIRGITRELATAAPTQAAAVRVSAADLTALQQLVAEQEEARASGEAAASSVETLVAALEALGTVSSAGEPAVRGVRTALESLDGALADVNLGEPVVDVGALTRFAALYAESLGGALGPAMTAEGEALGSALTAGITAGLRDAVAAAEAARAAMAASRAGEGMDPAPIAAQTARGAAEAAIQATESAIDAARQAGRMDLLDPAQAARDAAEAGAAAGQAAGQSFAAMTADEVRAAREALAAEAAAFDTSRRGIVAEEDIAALRAMTAELLEVARNTKGAEVEVLALEQAMASLTAASPNVMRMSTDMKASIAGMQQAFSEARRAQLEIIAAVQALPDEPTDVDLTGIRDMIVAAREAAMAMEGAEVEAKQLDEALDAIDGTSRRGVQGLKGVASALSEVRAAQIGWMREARASSPDDDTTGLAAVLTAHRRILEIEGERANVATARGRQALSAAELEQAAMAQVRAEMGNEINLLRLRGRVLDGTSSEAIAMWREEAAAIRQQAVEVGAAAEELLKLDLVVQQVEGRLTRMGHGVSGTSKAIDGLTTRTGRFTIQGRAAANAALQIGFAMQAAATNMDTAEGRMRGALQAASAVGLAFGPKGVVVAALAQASIAAMEFANRTTTAEKAAKEYAEELDGVRGAAERTTAALRSLTEQQALVRQFRVRVDLTEAQDSIRELRAEMREMATDDSFVTALRSGSTIRNFVSEIHSATEAHRAGALSLEEYLARVAEIGRRNPHVREHVAEFLALGEALQAAERRAAGLNAETEALRRLQAARPGDTITPLTEALEQQRELNAAREAGGRREAAILSRSIDAWAQYRTSALAPATARYVSFREAMEGTDPVLRTQAAAIRAQAEELERLTTAASDTGTAIERMAERVSEATARLALAREAGAPEGDILFLTQAVIAAERELTAAIEASGGARRANLEAIREQLRALDALRVTELEVSPSDKRLTLPKIETPRMDEGPLAEVLRMVEAVEQAEARLQAVELSVGVDSDAAQRAREELASVREAAESTRQAFATRMLSLREFLPADDFALVMAKFNEGWSRIEAGADDSADSIDGMRDAIRAAAQGGRGLLQIASGIDAVSDSTRQAIDGMLSLAEAAETAYGILANSADLNTFTDLFRSVSGVASVLGMIGGAVSLISSLTGGPSPTEVLIDKNNEELARLRAELSNVRGSFRDMETGLGASAGVIARWSADMFDSTRGPGALSGLRRDIVDQELAKLGTTFADVRRTAELFGITLVDAKGNISPLAFLQLSEALDLARQAALRLGDDLSSIIGFEQVRAELFGMEGPAEAWRQAIVGAERLFNDEVAQVMRGFDIDTDAGRQAAREYLQTLFTALEDDALALLSGTRFRSADEFLEWLRAANDPLRDLAEAASDVAGEMRNIPAGYKLDRARFDSMIEEFPEIIRQAKEAVSSPVPDARVPRPEYRVPELPDGPRREPGRASSGPTVVLRVENIAVDARDRSISEVFDELQDYAKRKAVETMGDSARANEVWSL